MADFATHVTSGGRLVIPAKVRKALGIRYGDEVLIRLDEQAGEVRIMTRRDRVKRAQSLVSSQLEGHRSLAEELVEERHNEADNDGTSAGCLSPFWPSCRPSLVMNPYPRCWNPAHARFAR